MANNKLKMAEDGKLKTIIAENINIEEMQSKEDSKYKFDFIVNFLNDLITFHACKVKYLVYI